jgi:hypothetical protein
MLGPCGSLVTSTIARGRSLENVACNLDRAQSLVTPALKLSQPCVVLGGE